MGYTSLCTGCLLTTVSMLYVIEGLARAKSADIQQYYDALNQHVRGCREAGCCLKRSSEGFLKNIDRPATDKAADAGGNYDDLMEKLVRAKRFL